MSPQITPIWRKLFKHETPSYFENYSPLKYRKNQIYKSTWFAMFDTF